MHQSSCILGPEITTPPLRLAGGEYSSGHAGVPPARLLRGGINSSPSARTTMQDDEVQTTTTPLSPKISPADKLAHGLGLPDNTGDGVRSPNSRMSTLSV